MIGFNNRNLNDFSVDLSVSETLAKRLPSGRIAVGESGIKTTDDARRLYSAGCKAVLIGETLMRSGIDGCHEVLKSFKEACLK